MITKIEQNVGTHQQVHFCTQIRRTTILFFFSIESITACEGRSSQNFDLPCIEIISRNPEINFINIMHCPLSGDLNAFEVIPLYQIVFKHSSRNQKKVIKKTEKCTMTLNLWKGGCKMSKKTITIHYEKLKSKITTCWVFQFKHRLLLP